MLGVVRGLLPAKPMRFIKLPSIAMSRLAGILTEEGAIVMPPAGEKYGANRMTVDVTTIPVEDDRVMEAIRAVVDGAANRLVRNESGEPGSAGLLGVFDAPNVHATLGTGFLERSVRDALVASVAEERRAEVDAILDDPAFTPYYVHLQLIDIGSEIVGNDVFVVHPFDGAEALVVSIFYCT